MCSCSVHFFVFFVFGVVIAGDIGESDILLLCALSIACFSLHMETNHQLVDHHTNDGAKEWGKNWNQEPAISSPEEWPEKEFNMQRFYFERVSEENA